MLFNPKNEDRLDRLAYQLRSAPALTPELISNVIADACTRLPVLNRAGKAVRIDRLIGAGAWNDAAVALIELELPAWKLRRLAYEEGEWHCPSSRICLWSSMRRQTRLRQFAMGWPSAPVGRRDAALMRNPA